MKNSTWLFILLLGMSFAACSGDAKENKNDEENSTSATDDNSSSDKASTDEPANLSEAMQQAQDAMKNLQGGKQVAVVPFRELQEFLPEKLAGYERTKKSGETTGALGMNVSHAKATYKDGDQQIKVDVVDTGGLGSAMMGMAAWSSITIDKEDDNGYERTSTLDGYKCFEKFRKSGSSSELSVIVGDRFLVTASGRTEDMGNLKKVIKDMDLGKLGRMK